MANSALTYVNAYVTLYNITQYLSFVKGGITWKRSKDDTNKDFLF